MKRGTKIRVILSGLLSVIFFPIVYLNVEKFAESRGWDGILTGLVTKMPDSLLAFLTSPMMAMLSSLVVGLIIGLWIDTVLRSADRRKSSLQVLGFQVSEMAKLIDQKSNSWGVSQDDCIEEYSASAVLLRKMKKKHGLNIPQMNPDDMLEDMRNISKYFKLMYPHMIDGDKGATKKFSQLIYPAKSTPRVASNP